MALPQDSPKEIVLRRWILLSYFAAFVFLGIPLWIKTTSIYRAPLNYKEMDFYNQHMHEEIDVNIPVYLNAGTEFPDIVEATQIVVDQELEEMGIKGWSLDFRHGVGSPEDYNVGLRLGDDNIYTISTHSRDVLITYNLDLVALGRVPELVAGVLLDHMFKPELEVMKRYFKSQTFYSDKNGDDNNDDDDMLLPSNFIVDYSPNYHLTFSLFYGGGDPISWDIKQALEDNFTPLRDQLSRVKTLTIDSQIQYYSNVANLPEKDAQGAYTFDTTDLSRFVNYAEWSLTSIHSYPTLHFILYVPAPDQTPMSIKDSVSNSFIVPQWGGVVIYNRNDTNNHHLSANDLLTSLEIFSGQFMALLGTPTLPKSPLVRIDFLSRISTVRALQYAADTLGSLHRLSKSLPNIAIPEPVLHSVEKTLHMIKKTLYALEFSKWTLASKAAGEAFTSVERAFFDKMMVQQAFFPEEHKLAIYMPLLAPAILVFFTGMVRVLKEYKNGGEQVDADDK